MVLGTCLVMLLLHWQIEITQVFFILALLNTGAAVVFWFYFRDPNQSRAGK